jgi:flagellar hook protein FlgE
MIISSGSTVSALSAFGKKMAVTANNVANVESEEFKKSRAVMTEGPQQTVAVEINKVDTPGAIVSEIENGELTERELSNVDLAEEIPQTIIAQRGYEANLKTMQTQDEMMESLIDIIG